MQPEEIRDRFDRHEREIAENRHGLNNTKQVFELKLERVVASLEELKNILKWAGGIIVTLMISFMSWSALQQYDANEAQKRDLQQQLDILQKQEDADTDRQRLLEQLRKDLDAGATITPVTPESGR